MSDPDPNVSVNDTSKDAAAILIFPPAVPLLTILAGIAFDWLFPFNSSLIPQAPTRYWVGGGIIIAAVYLLGFQAVMAIRRSGQTENPYKKTTKIIVSGPFRLTRNPMYLQMVLACIGFAVLLSNIWILVFTPVCALALHFLVILPEESYLEKKFGDAYLDYKRRVRRWI